MNENNKPIDKSSLIYLGLLIFAIISIGIVLIATTFASWEILKNTTIRQCIDNIEYAKSLDIDPSLKKPYINGIYNICQKVFK